MLLGQGHFSSLQGAGPRCWGRDILQAKARLSMEAAAAPQPLCACLLLAVLCLTCCTVIGCNKGRVLTGVAPTAAVLMQAFSSRTPPALVSLVLWLTVTQPGTAAATLPLQCPGDTLGARVV